MQVDATAITATLVEIATSIEIDQGLYGTTCYDIIPESSKVVIFDIGLPIKKALSAMIQK